MTPANPPRPPAPTTAIIEFRGGLATATYTIEILARDEARVDLKSVVPSRMDGDLRLGEPVEVTRDEKISILKAIGELEFTARGMMGVQP